MSELWLDITDIPATGREFSFSDQALWAGSIAEFALPYRLDLPETGLAAEFSVTLQGRSVLVSGWLRGKLVTPCDRCAEDVVLAVDTNFDLHEELPIKDEQSLEPGLVRLRGKILELDAGSLLWEQFLLALPVKPLCADDCPGLCPCCGIRLGEGSCGCQAEAGDPRMAVLRNLKVPRGSN